MYVHNPSSNIVFFLILLSPKETNLVNVGTVDLESADVDVLGGLLLLAHFIGGVRRGKDVQEVRPLLRSQEVEGRRVAVREHHQITTQRNLLFKLKVYRKSINM